MGKSRHVHNGGAVWRRLTKSRVHSCRVVQKALETLEDGEMPKLLTEFHHNVLSCIHDQNGNHVIQKCIEVMCGKAKKAKLRGDEVQAEFLEQQINFIIDDVMNNVRSLSCHPYGCRVLQRILEHCPEAKKGLALDEIKKFHKDLLDDQFGNYVIQHVLQFGRSTDRDSLLGIILANGLLILSRQKFASNVVEKLLKYGNADQRSRVVEEMFKVRLRCLHIMARVTQNLANYFECCRGPTNVLGKSFQRIATGLPLSF